MKIAWEGGIQVVQSEKDNRKIQSERANMNWRVQKLLGKNERKRDSIKLEKEIILFLRKDLHWV